MRALSLTALFLATPACAERSVSMNYFWTLDGEAAAMLVLGQTITDWASEGKLGNVDALASEQGLYAALPHAIRARTDIDLSAMDACAQATSTALAANDTAGTAVPTFAGTHAANAAVVGAATDAITAFFNSDKIPEEAATALADAIAAAR